MVDRTYKLGNRVNKELYFKLRSKLLDECKSFATWLEEQMEHEIRFTFITEPVTPDLLSGDAKKKAVDSIIMDKPTKDIDVSKITFRSAPGPGIAGHTEISTNTSEAKPAPNDPVFFKPAPKPKFNLKNKIK